jgi:hypothetical protein
MAQEVRWHIIIFGQKTNNMRLTEKELKKELDKLNHQSNQEDYESFVETNLNHQKRTAVDLFY